MGKRKLAGSLRGWNQATEVTRYSNEGIEAHLRGWDFGLNIEMRVSEDGIPTYEIWETGGSHNTSKIRQVFLTTILPN